MKTRYPDSGRYLDTDSQNLDSQNRVRVRVRVSYDCPDFDR